ncbi:sugar phosphate isomerase/epimerase [Halogeometricum borinquense]|uniref:Sugar phosphate isomerase/epimerase n=1 Tax=Halogeometricum borinquense TaxID=60847 RepID=A0A482TDY3_9EURY|nr:sugar phosphate isomerase/epimerase [Halogeometricum borinquense]RYJ19526.1 sugar phosphate isomerase/epimerase [Halogeometricum borinquense]
MERAPRPAIQLYSVRELPEPLPDVIRRVSNAGFEGVEFANRFFEEDPEAVADALAETGVVPVAAHADLSAVEEAVEGANDLLECLETVGCDRVIVPHISPRHFQTRWAVRSLSYRLTDVAHELDAHGVRLGYHTMRHDLYPMFPEAVGTVFDQTPVPQGVANIGAQALARLRRADPRADLAEIPSESGFWNLLARTTPEDVCFEVDVGEVTAAGFGPAAAVELAAGRIPCIHVRDVAATGRFGTYANADPGEGDVDFDAVAHAARKSGTEWLVYEHDDPDDPHRTIDDGAALLGRLCGDDDTDSAELAGSARIESPR